MQPRWVVVGSDGVLHREASQWLEFLMAAGRSPNTVREYGRRVAWFLSWCSAVVDWRCVGLSQLVMWRRSLSVDPTARSAASVNVCMVAVRSFYEWCDLRFNGSTQHRSWDEENLWRRSVGRACRTR
ncbi:site-specific integrase [Rhodococcus aetherivorans]|uniref:site-specific integrase n=1 Tax=Rhodococcus aetherivorans TaxID=191292 RepID=UPI003EBF727C